MTGWTDVPMVCERAGCSTPLEQPAVGRPRRFCSSACRKAANRVTARRRWEALYGPTASFVTHPRSDGAPAPSSPPTAHAAPDPALFA